MQTHAMTRVLAAALGALAAASAVASTESRCSSLNGPFCAITGVHFALEAPLYAFQDLGQEETEANQVDIAKRIKIENVIKQYELQEAASKDMELDIFVDVEMLLEEAAVLLGELDAEEASPLAGAFAFSSEGGAFALLEKMDGHELKNFFELALEEVLQSVEVSLQDLSPEGAQGVRTTARQMKAVSDFSTYSFQRLDDTLRASVRRRFGNHRLVELQQAFERLVVARTAQDRQLAFELSIFLFQLAQEHAAASKAAVDGGEATTAATSANSANTGSSGNEASTTAGEATAAQV